MSEKIDLNKVRPIQEISFVIQGEGSLMGVPHLLIRLSGCRLRCQFKDSFCDTWYASWKPEKGGFSMQDIKDKVRERTFQPKHVFITGGGPTLHKELLPALVDMCKYHLGMHVTIETEGSEFVSTNADLISLSPKGSNSTPRIDSPKPWSDTEFVTQKEVDQHEKWRKNYDAMIQFKMHQWQNMRDIQLKPVISDLESLEEFKELQKVLGISNSDCWLMPEGITDEQLAVNRQMLIKICVDEGYNYTDRLHVIAYGDKRGV